MATTCTGTGNNERAPSGCKSPRAVDGGDQPGVAATTPPRRGTGLIRTLSSFMNRSSRAFTPMSWGSEKTDRTEPMTPFHARERGGPNNPPPSTISEGEEPSSHHQQCSLSFRAEPAEETIVLVPEGGITPGMERTVFESKTHGFRLQVQGGSVPAHPPDNHNSGPITVAPLKTTFKFEGEELEGILEVHCLPDDRRFDAPLLFDFLVEGGDKADPIMDEYGRIRYEVLTKNHDSKKWIRDPEGSIPLEIVKDDQGRIYVRAQVRHFSRWGFLKKPGGDRPQTFDQEPISLLSAWWHRKRHQSLVQNDTDGVTVYAFAMRMSQWKAALKSFKVGAGAKGAEGHLDFDGSLHNEINDAALLPQIGAIVPGNCHWLEIPRVGGGVRSSRKAVVAIVTETNGEDGKKQRLEGLVHLRDNMKLTVTLPVEGGKVTCSPAASEDSGLLSLVKRVMQNQINATSGAPRPSAANTSQVNSAVSSAPTPTTGATGAPTTGAEGSGESGPREAFAVMGESKGDQDSPGLAAGGALGAAVQDEAGVARSTDEDEKSSNPTGVQPAVLSAPASALERAESGASCCPPPAELEALVSPVR